MLAVYNPLTCRRLQATPPEEHQAATESMRRLLSPESKRIITACLEATGPMEGFATVLQTHCSTRAPTTTHDLARELMDMGLSEDILLQTVGAGGVDFDFFGPRTTADAVPSQVGPEAGFRKVVQRAPRHSLAPRHPLTTRFALKLCHLPTDWLHSNML